MTQLLKKLKMMATGALALLFIMAVTLSSCGSTEKSSDDSDAVEEASAQEEHPAGEEQEHPAGDDEKEGGEHPEGEDQEHPSDSTAKDSEHPEGEVENTEGESE